MKKTLLVILMCSLTFAAFADDAKVLPAGVIRTYVVPTFATNSEVFDTEGERVDDSNGTTSFFNVGTALEFGVTDWISAAVQWAPGYNVYSDVENNEYVAAEGAFELFAGAKIQVLGDQGLVKNDKFRFAFAPGIMVPMAFGYDAVDEATSAVNTGAYIQYSGAVGALENFNMHPATGAFGLGGRIYVDYVVNDFFFINLYSEFIKYLVKDAEDDFEASVQNAQDAFTQSMNPLYTYTAVEEVDCGFKYTGEVDFNFSKQLSDDLILSGGLPVTFSYSPAVQWDGNDMPGDVESYSLGINPSVGVMVLALPLPLEFEVSYGVPFIGQDEAVRSVVTAQIKAYMKF